MQSQVQAISPVLYEVKVEVPWDQVQGDLDTRLERLRRTARIRGFRPGKAPKSVVRQYYGETLRNEVVSAIVDQGLRDVVREHDLQLVTHPQIDAQSIEDGHPVKITAQLEVRPAIAHVDITKLDIELPHVEVKEADIDAEIDRLREQHAEIRVVEPPRAARSGDQLRLSVEGFINDQEVEELRTKDYDARLETGRLRPEFEAALPGMLPGECKSVEVDFPADDENEKLRGQRVRFAVTLQQVAEVLLPTVDDEFAKDCGDYADLASLREKIGNDQRAAVDRQQKSSIRDKLIDRLIEANDVALPPSMVQQQHQQIVFEHMNFLKWVGLPLQAPDDELRQSMRMRAERRVRAGLLLSALARQENVSVDAEEIQQRLMEIADRSGKHPAKVRADYQNEDRLEALTSKILEEKIMNLLQSRAQIRVAAPEPSST